MPSFDVVSKVDWHEINNALDQASREVLQRYDFKGTDTKLELKEEELSIESVDEFKVKQCLEVVEGKLAKRKVPLGALDRQKIEPAGGGRSRQLIRFKSGIEQDAGKKIVKKIKDRKMKVQASIQGDSVRVSGKKRDDLQEVIGFLEGESFGQPLQFENFRD